MLSLAATVYFDFNPQSYVGESSIKFRKYSAEEFVKVQLYDPSVWINPKPILSLLFLLAEQKWNYHRNVKEEVAA